MKLANLICFLLYCCYYNAQCVNQEYFDNNIIDFIHPGNGSFEIYNGPFPTLMTDEFPDFNNQFLITNENLNWQARLGSPDPISANSDLLENGDQTFSFCPDYIPCPSNIFPHLGIKPIDGCNMIGLTMHKNNDPEFGEAIQIEFQQFLEEGEVYVVSAFVHSSMNAYYTTNNLSISVSNHYNLWCSDVNWSFDNYPNQITYQDGWIQLKGEFIATGEEKYLTIGPNHFIPQ